MSVVQTMVQKLRLSPIRSWAWTLAIFALLVGAALGSAHGAQASESNVLTLEEAVERALVHAPGVVSAQRSLERGSLNLESAEIAFKPRASASASGVAGEGGTGVRAGLSGSGTLAPGATWSVSATHASRTGPVGGQDFSPQPLSASLSVNVRLWPPGRDADNWRTLDARQFELATAEARLAQAERSAVVEVVQTYGRLVAARSRLAMALEALEISRRDLERQKDRRARGMASELDVLRAEIALLEQEGTISSRRQSVDALTATFAQLVGLSPAAVEQSELESIRLDVGAWQPPDQDAAIERATEVSLSVRAQVRALEAAEESLDVLRRQGGPTISLGGTVNARTDDDIGWTVRIDGSYDLFDSGARANRLASAERDAADAKRALDEALEAVRSDVAAAYREIANSERAVAIAAATLQLREFELEIGREQAARGLISEEALHRIERDARSARYDLEDAQLAHYVALMNLKVLLGLDP